MLQFRTIAAMLAMSALLLAGWTNATHFHLANGGEQFGASVSGCSAGSCSDLAVDSRVASEVSSPSKCCPIAVAEQAERSNQPTGDIPEISSGHAAHEHGGCLICDFLAGQSDALTVSFQFAGMIAAGSALPELLPPVPARTLRGVSCRGPPALA